MSRALQLAKIAALACLCTLLLSLTIAVRSITPKVTYTLENANRTIRETAQTVANIRHATEEWEKASQAQAATATKTEERAAKSLADLDALIQHTDSELNRQVLPALRAAIAANSDQLAGLENQTNESMQHIAADADTITQQTALVMQAAAKDLSDPSIQASLKNTEATTANMAAATASLDRTTQNLEQYARRLTKPASMLKQIALGALQVGYQLRGLLGL